MKKSDKGYLLIVAAALICLFLGVVYRCDAQRPCDFIIKSAEYSWDAKAKGVKPGQTVCFQSGTRSSIDIYNLVGTQDQQVLLTNEPTGKIIFQGNGKTNTQGFYTTPFAAQIHGSSNFRVTGSNNPAEEYGWEIQKSHMGIDIRSLSTDFEVDHLYVHDVSSVALVFKSDPSCSSSTWRGNFTMKNIKIYHNKVENTVNEGTYIGNSHYTSGVTKTCSGVSTKILEHDVIDVEVYDNIFINIGYDGIQVGSTVSGMNVHDNIVNGFGLKSAYGHQSGIQVNQGSTGNIYRNRIENGTGFGIFLGGSGGISVYENLVIKAEQGGALVSDFAPVITKGFRIENNTFIDCKDYILWINNKNTIGNIFRNNISASTRIKTDLFFNSSAQKATWSSDGNIITTDLASLKLDSNYVPLPGSPAIVPDGRDKGYAQHVPVEITTPYEGKLEVLETVLDAVVIRTEVWIIYSDNKRIRIK